MPPKVKTIFVCSACDAQFPKWVGRCATCGAWGTVQPGAAPAHPQTTTTPGTVVSFADVSSDQTARIATGISEFDRVVGGGLSPGSLTLLAGEPGIGKSTLVLQVAERIARALHHPALYVSGEESAGQIKDRMLRLKLNPQHFSYLGETDVQTIAATVHANRPPISVVDSVQTIRSPQASGSLGGISQIKACTAALVDAAKSSGTPILLVGHITKDGVAAGPKTLEHLVDTVLYLEGDGSGNLRLLRPVKNRFGATAELGVFEMHNGGLREVANPAAMFLASRSAAQVGAVVTPVMIGERVFLAEIQALVSWTRYGYPQRNAVGYDYHRLNLIATVLDQRVGVRLGKNDIHLKIGSGLRVLDPGADLAVALAIASAQRKRALPKELAVCGEVGLDGDVRPVARVAQRVREAAKLGFTMIIVPKAGGEKLPPTCLEIATVQDALRELWGG